MEATEDATKSTANCGVADETSAPESHEKNRDTKFLTTSEVTNKKYEVWLHFMKKPDKVRCMHCLILISCRTKSGPTTSAMKKHIKTCKQLRPSVTDAEVDGKRFKQSTLHHRNQIDGSSGSKVSSFLNFSQPATRKALVEMIIMDELPFRFVEHKGFKRFMTTVQPLFEISSRKTVAKDCLKIYEDEMSKLRKFFRSYKGSVSLTMDCWTFVQNMNYMCLTAHYIDENWKLHKRIINFCLVDNHAGEIIGKVVEKCLVFWRISKVFTITVDNASSNDLALKYLKRKLTSWGTIILNAEFLHMRCGAHILGLIMRDGFQEVHDSVLKIRSAVRFVRSSPSRLKRFKECLEFQKVESKVGLCLDVETRWNSTFLMLQSALELKKEFDMLELEDDKYGSELTRICGGTPSDADWCYVSALSHILYYFYDATVNISGFKYVTRNTYMKEIFGVGWMIMKMDAMEDGHKKAMTYKMKVKFYKYWRNIDNTNLMIYIAAVLDPRYKMRWVKWMIEGSYPRYEASCLIQKITEAMDRLEIESQDSLKSHPEKKNPESCSKKKESRHTLMDEMFDDAEESNESDSGKSELESYMDDVRENRKNLTFDILNWWRTTCSKYKILSMMARDLLVVSTVASESAFSTGGRVLDRFRSSLTPKTIEALICTQDWYHDDNGDLIAEKLVAELEKIELEVTNLQTQPRSSLK